TRSARLAARVSVSAADTPSTVSMPRRAHASTMRTAISPRLATKMRCRSRAVMSGGVRAEREQHVAELDELGVCDVAGDDRAVNGGLDRVHELHDLDDADG